MTNYSRKNAKIFGETASPIGTDPDIGPEIGQFGSAKAGTYNGTNDIDVIQSLPAWSNGWVDAVTPSQQFPTLPERTAVDYVQSYQNAYLLQKGVAEWDSGTTYYTTSYCQYSGAIYRSKIDSNLNNTPIQNASNEYWQFLGRDFLNTNQITNCILETPQRINLELASNVLTLKAGSKVIVPNGFDGTTPKFDEVTIENDIVFSSSGTSSYTTLFIINTSSNAFTYSNMSYIISGSTPSQTTNGTIWYDTANNVIKVRSSGAWVTNGCSFPVGLITLDSGTPTEINQVFNGFGFIGSVVFADKGIKGLTPNGRNADGSLNNTEFTTSAIKTLDITSTLANVSTMLFINDNGLNYSSSLIYKPDENLCYQDGDLRYLAYCGRVTLNDNKKITSLIYHSGLNINELIDGKTHHVVNGTIVEGATSPSSTRITYDLSTFLPDTNDEYMALITGSIATGTTSNNIGALLLNTSLLSDASVRLAQVKTFSSSANYNSGSVWLPIGADRKINVEPATSNTGTFNLYIRAYRKIGGNY